MGEAALAREFKKAPPREPLTSITALWKDYCWRYVTGRRGDPAIPFTAASRISSKPSTGRWTRKARTARRSSIKGAFGPSIAPRTQRRSISQDVPRARVGGIVRGLVRGLQTGRDLQRKGSALLRSTMSPHGSARTPAWIQSICTSMLELRRGYAQLASSFLPLMTGFQEVPYPSSSTTRTLTLSRVSFVAIVQRYSAS
jgi:hypothetical protein